MGKLYIKQKYGQIPNEILNNPNLSLKAKGLFGFLQSKPDGWKFSKERIAEQTKEGKIGIMTGLQELEECGFLERKLEKENNGNFAGYNYYLIENIPSSQNVSTEEVSTVQTDEISKKDNSKKDNSNKDFRSPHQNRNPDTANQRNQGPDNTTLEKTMNKNINDLIDVFWQEHKDFSKNSNWFGRKGYREAAQKLIESFGYEEAIKIAKLAVQVQGQQYAPLITDPLELQRKIVKLKSFINRKQEENNNLKGKIVFGSDFSDE